MSNQFDDDSPLDLDEPIRLGSRADGNADFPLQVELNLIVGDPDLVAELCAYPEGTARDEFALNALRIGMRALRQARGQIDVERIRREGDRLVENLGTRLGDHARSVNEKLTDLLKRYFDPHDGQFHERLERLVKKDGELEKLLEQQIGSENSRLWQTLAAHVGQESPLLKLLRPDQSEGLLATLHQTVEKELEQQRQHLLAQFSLDNKEGALCRFITELSDRQGQLSELLHGRINVLVREFSLDDENSALSRLVKNVDRAQQTITSEFSLDEKNSALARLKSELCDLLNQDREDNRKFQEEVKLALREMAVRKQEAARSTRHGITFEEALFTFLQHEAQQTGDVAVNVGDTIGEIARCKTGDHVIELGPESAAPGARIVFEAKEDASYTLKDALSEMEVARKNREAQIGVFVFSKRAAPEGLAPLARYANDLVVVWDAEDASTDLCPKMACTVARALCVRSRQQSVARDADFTEIDKAIDEVEKQHARLDQMNTWSNTIHSNSQKLLAEIVKMRAALEEQVELLRDKTAALKDLLESTPEEA